MLLQVSILKPKPRSVMQETEKLKHYVKLSLNYTIKFKRVKKKVHMMQNQLTSREVVIEQLLELTGYQLILTTQKQHNTAVRSCSGGQADGKSSS